jgi:hypothetical protein
MGGGEGDGEGAGEGRVFGGEGGDGGMVGMCGGEGEGDVEGDGEGAGDGGMVGMVGMGGVCGGEDGVLQASVRQADRTVTGCGVSHMRRREAWNVRSRSLNYLRRLSKRRGVACASGRNG